MPGSRVGSGAMSRTTIVVTAAGGKGHRGGWVGARCGGRLGRCRERWRRRAGRSRGRSSRLSRIGNLSAGLGSSERAARFDRRDSAFAHTHAWQHSVSRSGLVLTEVDDSPQPVPRTRVAGHSLEIHSHHVLIIRGLGSSSCGVRLQTSTSQG